MFGIPVNLNYDENETTWEKRWFFFGNNDHVLNVDEGFSKDFKTFLPWIVTKEMDTE